MPPRARRCKCAGHCGSPRCVTRHGEQRCTAVQGQPHPVTGGKVTLTTAHWCGLCHLAYGRRLHEQTRLRTRLAAEQNGMESLFDAP